MSSGKSDASEAQRPYPLDIMVRDRKQVHIRQDRMRLADMEEFEPLLVERLREDMSNLMRDGFRSPEAFADVLEAMYALGSLNGVSPEAIEQARQTRLEEEGGFEEGMVWSENRAQKSSERVLSISWSRREQDFVIKFPAKVHGNVAHSVFFNSRVRSDFKQVFGVAYEPSFVDQLRALGYDMTTMKFRVERLPEACGEDE